MNLFWGITRTLEARITVVGFNIVEKSF